MPWVTFVRNYEHRMRRGRFVSYPAGATLYLPRGVTVEAVAKGAAEPAHEPKPGAAGLARLNRPRKHPRPRCGEC